MRYAEHRQVGQVRRGVWSPRGCESRRRHSLSSYRRGDTVRHAAATEWLSGTSRVGQVLGSSVTLPSARGPWPQARVCWPYWPLGLRGQSYQPSCAGPFSHQPSDCAVDDGRRLQPALRAERRAGERRLDRLMGVSGAALDDWPQ